MPCVITQPTPAATRYQPGCDATESRHQAFGDTSSVVDGSFGAGQPSSTTRRSACAPYRKSLTARLDLSTWTATFCPCSRDDLALACGFLVALAPDSTGQAPLIAQPGPGRVVASFRQFARHPEPAPERAS